MCNVASSAMTMQLWKILQPACFLTIAEHKTVFKQAPGIREFSLLDSLKGCTAIFFSARTGLTVPLMGSHSVFTAI